MPFHGPELIIILVVALLIFGPKKLPEMGSAIGKSIKEFKKGMNELTASKEEKEERAAAANLEAIEREIAAKKAAANAAEAKQPEVEVSNSEAKVD
jgi:sec-independent protein translocase protein TatA